VSANASGGVTGKMISPQSIAIGAAAVGLVGKESDLFRFTVKHSFIMLFIICLLTGAQAYVIPWIIPPYRLLETAIAAQTANISTGFMYLWILALVLALVTALVLLIDRKKVRTS
jgi:lactate permease